MLITVTGLGGNMPDSPIHKAMERIAGAQYLTAFTGAGISVESGVPPFRGEHGIWNQYDPRILELDYFYRNPGECWTVIRDLFYRNFAASKPNDAHYWLAELENRGKLKLLITQNIDDLHYRAGSRNVVEYHGNCRRLLCTRSGNYVPAESINLLEMKDDEMPPRSPAGGVYKPDFIFFGEGIPREAQKRSLDAVDRSDVMIVIGSTGEVYPAASIPLMASRRGAVIIEINPQPSAFTSEITDIHLQMTAGDAARQLQEILDDAV